jgi:arylsulfatase A-like enzyme
MKSRLFRSLANLGVLCWFLAFLEPLTTQAAGRAGPPNIVFMLADDLGYGEIGCYGQKKIRTPNLDRLSAGGMRFTQHYSGNAVCAPSRCVLMTGKHPGHAWVRDNGEVKPEGQIPLPASEVTIASLLKARGYTTGAFGKWGLGPVGSEGDPMRHGFDRFFGYNCQRVAHNSYPTHLWDNAERVPLRNADFSPHQRLTTNAAPGSADSYRGFTGVDYAPDRIGEQARAFIRANKDRPFFLYYPTTVPHLALQVPEDSVKEYEGQWPDPPYPGGNSYLPNRTPRAAYAAMVTRMDREVGRFMELIRELGLEENTIFVFTSDNGPTYDRLGGSDSAFFDSAAGLRGLKGSLYEGGIRVPLIVSWSGHIAAGSVQSRVCGFEDWLPTLLELAGAADAAPPGIDGISLVPTLLGRPQEPRPFLYREFPGYGGQQFVRVGDWKAVRQKLLPGGRNATPRTQIELFDLSQDRSETKDVAADHPEVVARLGAIMRSQHARSSQFPIPALDELAATRP